MQAPGAFQLEMPRSIHFGGGSLSRLPAAASGAPRILLLTGRRLSSPAALPAEVAALAEGRGYARAGVDEGGPAAERILLHVSCPSGEPTTDGVRALRTAVGRAPDLIVALGGGSVLDTAKALSALLRHAGQPEDYLEGLPGSREVPGPCVPWVAVPTTAGTGAEATKNAVLIAPSRGVKRSMRSPFLLAQTVLVDPSLTRGLDRAVMGATGMDAFVQLLEAYVSRRSNVPVRSLVKGALLPHLEGLRALAIHPDDGEARASVSYGALVSGIALANAGLGAAHGFAAAVGGRFPIPHGLLCAVFLPAVLSLNAEAIRGDLAALLPDAARADPVAWLSDAVRSIAGSFGLPADLKSYGIPRSLVPELARLSSGASMRGNPRDLGDAEKEEAISRLI